MLKGEKEIVKLNKEDKEWKTFAQMRAEIDEGLVGILINKSVSK